jgi:hypothetical protein
MKNTEQKNALVNYVMLHFEHQKAKEQLGAATTCEHLLRNESQEAWRELKRLDVPSGAHIIWYMGLPYIVEVGAGDYQIPLPVIE